MTRPLERPRAGLVGGHGHDLDALSTMNAIQERLQVGAFAGGQDGDVHAARSFGNLPPVERSVPASSS